MCLYNSNIEATENNEKKKNSDLSYEDRLKIEEMLRSRTKYTIQQIADKITEIYLQYQEKLEEIAKKNGIMIMEIVSQYIQQRLPKENMNIERKALGESLLLKQIDV